MNTRLKPTTTYSYSKADLDFCTELMKIGHVHIMSSQVVMKVLKESHSSAISFSFKEFASEGKGCDGLKLPDNWVVEYIFSDGNQLSITFGVHKIIIR